MSDPTEPLPATTRLDAETTHAPVAPEAPAVFSEAPAAFAGAATGAAPTSTPTAKNRWITPALALVAALAVGLAGGVLIGHSTATTQAGNISRQGGQGFGGAAGGNGGGAAGGAGAPGAGGTTGGFQRGNFTSGTITSIDGATITITEADGSTKKITTSGATKVTKTATSTVDALKPGEKINVLGLGADGSGTATSITEGALRQFGARPGAAAGAGTNG